MKKIKIFKILLFMIIIIIFSIAFIKVFKFNQTFDINVVKVDEINSELYEYVTFYNYNEANGQYELQSKFIKKEFVVNEIFNYYNDNLQCMLVSYKLNNNELILNLNNNDIDVFTFKKIKLSFKSININSVLIENSIGD